MNKTYLNKTNLLEALEFMQTNSAKENKRGIAFIAASVCIWGLICVIHISDLPIETKNLFSWFVSALLMPIVLLINKVLKIKLQNKENPLNQAGLLFTMNQMLYILIVCWICAAVPEKMIMVWAMVFGGHLLPYGWLYNSKSYIVFSVLIVLVVLAIGIFSPAWVVALMMVLLEAIFAGCLAYENRTLEI